MYDIGREKERGGGGGGVGGRLKREMSNLVSTLVSHKFIYGSL